SAAASRGPSSTDATIRARRRDGPRTLLDLSRRLHKCAHLVRRRLNETRLAEGSCGLCGEGRRTLRQASGRAFRNLNRSYAVVRLTGRRIGGMGRLLTGPAAGHRVSARAWSDWNRRLLEHEGAEHTADG